MHNSLSSRQLIVALAGAGLLACAATPALAAGDETARVVLQPRMMLAPAQRERLQKIADQGFDSLRRYCWRTRGIYNYFLPDLLGERSSGY